MKKNIPLTTLVLLLLILGYLIFENKNTLFKKKTLDGTAKSTQVDVQENKYNLPVREGSVNVGSVLIHYFFTGKLKALKKTDGGTQIIYQNADPALPVLIATSKTRISKITPPYDVNHVFININELKVGQTVDTSAEFDIKTGLWSVLDVFLATDRN